MQTKFRCFFSRIILQKLDKLIKQHYVVTKPPFMEKFNNIMHSNKPAFHWLQKCNHVMQRRKKTPFMGYTNLSI